MTAGLYCPRCDTTSQIDRWQRIAQKVWHPLGEVAVYRHRHCRKLVAVIATAGATILPLSAV